MGNLILVAFGGALGSMARYALSGATLKILGSNLPYGTLAVNLAGSLGAGIILGSFGNLPVAPATRLFLVVGFLGGFTTFSAFSMETISLLRDGQARLAVAHILLNNVLGIGLAFVGYWMANNIRPLQ